MIFMLRHQSFPCATVVSTSMWKKTFPINKIIYIRLLEEKKPHKLNGKKIRLITVLLIYWRTPADRQFMIYWPWREKKI